MFSWKILKSNVLTFAVSSFCTRTFYEGLPHNATRSSATAKSTARPSCLVGVLYDISRGKICWWLISHFYVIGHESYRIRRNNAK